MSHRAPLSVLLLATLVACSGGDPPPGGVPGGMPGSGGPPTGAPPTGAGTAMQPGGAGGMGGAMQQPGAEGGGLPTFQVAEGEGVTLSGTVSFDGELEGELRLDVVSGAPNTPNFAILHAGKLEALGEWTLEVPKDQGSITVVGFMDANGNGPEASEASAFVADIDVGSEDISGIDLVLEPGGAAKYAPAGGGGPGGGGPGGGPGGGGPGGPAQNGPGGAPGAAAPGGAAPGGAAPAGGTPPTGE